MALTNAEKQKRWREKRNARAGIFDSEKPKDVADAILRQLGAEQARKIAHALDKRMRALNRNCLHCKGTGFLHFQTDGGIFPWPCDCGPKAAAMNAPPQAYSFRVIVTDKAGQRWENGVRFKTREEAEEYAEIHVREKLAGEVEVETTEILRCEEEPKNSIIHQRGKSRLCFTDGECHLLGWNPIT